MSLVTMLVGLAACFIFTAICLAISSSIQSISSKKAKLRLAATLCFAGCFFAFASSGLVYQAHLPIFEVSGQIEQAQVHAEGRGHRTTITIGIAGGKVLVNADGTSPFFHPGQRIRGQYQGITGHILKAHFLSESGSEVGIYNGTDTWPPYGLLLIGLFLLFVGYKKYQRNPRNPEAAEKA